MPLLEKQLEVRDSQIPNAGKGLFTAEFIPKGARIVEYKGKMRRWKEVEFDDSNYYIFYIDQEHVIDSAKGRKSLARYINDARGLQKVKGLRNNAEFVVDRLKVYVEATRNIPAGSEILVGYGKEYWDVIRSNQKADKKKLAK
jgi:SET domain-containing protein